MIEQSTYTVPQWIKSALENLRPRERVPVSVWAERNRILPETNAIPGPWKNSVTPYLTEIMDTFSSGDVEEIVFVKPTQVGGTAAMENMLASLIDQEPAPTMIVYPSDKLAERTAEAKIMPMIQRCKPLRERYREAVSQKLELKFGTMTVYLTGANSPANLSSTPIKYLFLDEVDKYPPATKREAGAMSLAVERTKTYTTSRRIFYTSTPTLRTGNVWRLMEDADETRHYFVPCPHCGEYIELKFAQLKWPSSEEEPENKKRAERAAYVCQACGCVINDRDKGQMLRGGRWKAIQKRTATPRRVAFWLSTLYSPFTKFTEIAEEFLRCKDDPELLHNFSNSWLAEPWEDASVKTNEDLVLERQTDTEENIVPAWAQLLTGGIDVQETCVYWTIRAWGPHMTSQKIASGQALSLQAVEEIMALEYQREDGGGLELVQLALVDSGDQTEDVYDFAAQNTEWVLPCKGTKTMLSHYKISTINKPDSKANGSPLVLVDGGKYKDMIAGRMKKPNGNGSWMVHKECGIDYAKQVTAEHKVTVRSSGTVTQRWQLKSSHADNHYLDCEVYAAAAADLLGVRTLHLKAEAPEQPKPKTTQPKQREESWIRENDWV